MSQIVFGSSLGSTEWNKTVAEIIHTIFVFLGHPKPTPIRSKPRLGPSMDCTTIIGPYNFLTLWTLGVHALKYSFLRLLKMDSRDTGSVKAETCGAWTNLQMAQ